MNNPQTPKKITKRKKSNICRTCATETARFGKIFSKVGYTKNLALKIYQITNIVVKETDEISLDICRPCEDLVERLVKFQDTISKFQERCQNAQVELRKHYSIKRGIISPTSEKNKEKDIIDS